MRSKSIRRGLVIAATATGLWALGATAAQADEPPTLGGTLGTVTHGVTRGAQHAVKHTADGAGEAVPGTVARTAKTVGGMAHHGLPHTVSAVSGAGDVVRTSVGKAVPHATQEAGKALPEPKALPAGAQLGNAVSGVQAATAASAAQGLPEDLNIGLPQVIPGVPSISLIPLSLPALSLPPLPLSF
jgi:hypothetical protein